MGKSDIASIQGCHCSSEASVHMLEPLMLLDCASEQCLNAVMVPFCVGLCEWGKGKILGCAGALGASGSETTEKQGV